MKESRFFSGIDQVTMQFKKYKTKAPLFYPKVHMMGGIFTADVKSTKELLPTTCYHPLYVLPKRVLVGIHCMEYLESDIGPYNELSLTAFVQYGKFTIPSPLTFAWSYFHDDYHGYVLSLPVNTDISLQGGIEYFNFPKYLADITFRETQTHRVCTVRDIETKDLIIECEGRKISTMKVSKNKKEQVLKTLMFNSYPFKEKQVLHAKAQFNLIESSMSYGLGNFSFRLGKHDNANIFKKLQLGNQLHYTYAPECEGILFLPTKV